MVKKKEGEEEKKITDVPGIGPGIATKLEAAGVYDLMGLAVLTPASLSEMAGIGEAVARKAIQAARDMMDLGFSDGLEFAKKREDVCYITTGSENLDNLLGGRGVETRAMTEAYGQYGSGKSQLAFMLAVNVQLPKSKGGAEGKAVLIDTEGTFRPKRIRQIAEAIGANPEKVLKNILVARAFNSDHQILLIDKISEMIKNGEPIKLLIIDSLTAHFRAEFSGRGQLADRQQKLNRYLHNLIRLAEHHNLAIYVTNQVMANPGMMFGDPTTAIGGNILGHACLTGDSLIQLSDGSIKEIKNILGDKVISSNFLNMKNESADSEQLFINKNVDKIYNVKTNCQINCSGLHRFFGVENFGIREKEARELKEGEFIAQVGKMDIKGEERSIPNFKIKRIGKLSKESADFIKEKLEKDAVRKEVCERVGITQRQFRRVLNQNYSTSLDVFNNLQNCFGSKQILQILPAISCKHRDLIIPEFLNPALAQICGYFIGDGNLENYGLRFRDSRVEVLQRYNLLFKKTFNLEGKINKVNNKNCFSLDINSKEIRNFFELLLSNILTEIGKSKEESVIAFAKGFIDAEGHIDKKRATITVAQKKKEILRYLQMFLIRCGIRATIKFGIGRKKINVLRIADKDVINYLKIGFTASDKQKRLIECVKEIEGKYNYEMMPVKREELKELLDQCGLKFSKIIRSRPESYRWVSRRELEKSFSELMNCKIEDRQTKQKIDFIFKLLKGDIAFEKIREISIKENDGRLFYDFSVPLNQNYMADGFIVHNSTYRIYLRRGKAGSRVAKMIDSPNLPENETLFYLTEGGIKDKE